MHKSTQELLTILRNSPNINDYIDNEQENMTQTELHQYLKQLLSEKKISPSELIRCSGLDRTYAYQILSGTKTPSRNKVLALCFALTLSFEETQALLKSTGYPILYARIKNDSIIIFALQHKAALADVNELLFDFGYEPLC